MDIDTVKSRSPTWPQLVAGLVDQLDLRANSLIITVFGDAILPRGGTLWLGSLITLARCFRVSERLVRTGVYRLSQEGWLTSRSRGRRSFYSITDSGLATFQAAQARIYADGPRPWSNEWWLLQVLDASQAERQALRRELGWLGMGQIGPTLFGHPAADGAALRSVVATLGLSDRTLLFSAALDDVTGRETVRRIAGEAWPLAALSEDYADFIRTFRSVARMLETRDDLTPRDCFALRILLIHDYRRILLKDPQLPVELLPDDWRGGEARELCAALYKTVAARAETYIAATVETEEALAGPADFYWQRFGGLPRS